MRDIDRLAVDLFIVLLFGGTALSILSAFVCEVTIAGRTKKEGLVSYKRKSSLSGEAEYGIDDASLRDARKHRSHLCDPAQPHTEPVQVL